MKGLIGKLKGKSKDKSKGKFTGKKKLLLIPLILVFVLVVAAVVFTFVGGGGSDGEESVEKEEKVKEPKPVEAPMQYKLESLRILALPVGEDVVAYKIEEPESLAAAALALEAEEENATKTEPTVDDSAEADSTNEDEDGADAEEEQMEEYPLIGYRYEGLEDARTLVAAYSALLATKDIGFTYAADNLKPASEAPTVDEDAGTLYLTGMTTEAESGDSEKQTVAMRIDWEDTTCAITMELMPTSMTVLPHSSSSGLSQQITFSGAVDTIKRMTPASLGLEGETMEDYRVYSRDGLVLINGQSCMRIDIYRKDGRTDTHIAAGNYYLSSDGLHLYRFDTETQTMHELSGSVNYVDSTAVDTADDTDDKTDEE